MMKGYSLRLGLCIVTSLIWLWFAAPIFNIKRNLLAKWLWLLSLITLASGRLGYVLMHTTYFHQNPGHILQLHRIGGLHGESALLGSLIGLGILGAIEHKKSLNGHNGATTDIAHSFLLLYRRLLALFTPAILVIVVGAWWACLHAGCAWGRSVSLTNLRNQWFFSNSPDLYRIFRLRYPVQVLGLIWAFMSGIFSAVRANQTYHGTLALMAYCLGGALLTLLRGDEVPTLGQIRVDTLENIGIAIILGVTRWWHALRPSLKRKI